MRRLVFTALCFAVFSFVPLAAQDDGPNFYRINYIEVLDSDYYTYLREVLYPVYDEWIRMGLIVSYDGVVQMTGAGEVTMLGITEFPTWDVGDNFTRDMYDEASQAAHGMPWAEAVADYTLSELRRIIRTELYQTIKR